MSFRPGAETSPLTPSQLHKDLGGYYDVAADLLGHAEGATPDLDGLVLGDHFQQHVKAAMRSEGDDVRATMHKVVSDAKAVINEARLSGVPRAQVIATLVVRNEAATESTPAVQLETKKLAACGLWRRLRHRFPKSPQSARRENLPAQDVLVT